MGRIDTDTKLQLIHDIRMQNRQNRITCRERERFLYGREPVSIAEHPYELHSAETLVCPNESIEVYKEKADRPSQSMSSFRLRLILAVFLFCGFLFLDRSGMELWGKTAEELFFMLTETLNPGEMFAL